MAVPLVGSSENYAEKQQVQIDFSDMPNLL